MRSLTTKVTSAVESTGTVPRYLVRLGYDPVLRWSTVETLTCDGVSWDGSAGVSVSSISSASASVVIPNHDNSMGAVVLGDGIRDITADIYQLYGAAPHAAGDAVHLFSGVIDSVPSIDDFVTLSLRSTGSAVAHTPRVRLSLFVGDDMPTPGTRIQWNGDVLILESST